MENGRYWLYVTVTALSLSAGACTNLTNVRADITPNSVQNFDQSNQQPVKVDGVTMGRWGTCPWRVEDNTLTIGKTGQNYKITQDTEGKSPFAGIASDVTAIQIDGNIDLPGDSSRLFFNMPYLQTIHNLNRLNTSQVENMSTFFGNDASLTYFDISDWDTSKMTDMGGMFVGDSSLTALDLSKWNTSKVINMNGMFGGDLSLVNLDLSNFNTSNVTDMGEIFEGDSGLISLDLSNWDTSKVPLVN